MSSFWISLNAFMCIASLKKKCTTSLENRKDTCASSFKCQLSLSYSLFPPFSFAILFTLQTSRNEQEISRGSYSFLHFYLANNSLQSHYKQNRFKVELSLSLAAGSINTKILSTRISIRCTHPYTFTELLLSQYIQFSKRKYIDYYIDATRINPSLPWSRRRSAISDDSSAPLTYLMNLSSRGRMPRQVSSTQITNYTTH